MVYRIVYVAIVQDYRHILSLHKLLCNRKDRKYNTVER